MIMIIYYDKGNGVNWMQQDMVEGFSKSDIIMKKHAPPHREKGFYQQLDP